MTYEKLSKKEFIKLQTEWYKKLEKSGFQDIEWYNPSNGLGQGSPFLNSSNAADSGRIRSKFTFSLQKHFQLAENFLSHAPFYQNSKETWKDLPKTHPDKTKYRTFKAYFAAQAPNYSRAEYHTWKLYCEGDTYREISKKLRQLHHHRRLGNPPEGYKKAAHMGQPYSVYWVKTRLDKLKTHSMMFNYNHEEGLYYQPHLDQVDEAAQWLPENNKAIGELAQPAHKPRQLKKHAKLAQLLKLAQADKGGSI